LLIYYLFDYFTYTRTHTHLNLHTFKMYVHISGKWRETAGAIPTIEFEAISTPVLEKVIQYFYYKRKYDHTPPPIPAFKISLEEVVALLLAANFLDT
jgi:transcription elongation factor B subunit 1